MGLINDALPGIRNVYDRWRSSTTSRRRPRHSHVCRVPAGTTDTLSTGKPESSAALDASVFFEDGGGRGHAAAEIRRDVQGGHAAALEAMTRILTSVRTLSDAL
jgi:hypothetical protein